MVLKHVAYWAASAFVLLATSSAVAQERTKGPNLGLLMWSAFSCATYAELAGDEPEHKRLFDIGYRAGVQLLDGIRSKTISESALREMPIGVTLRLAGPSIDFMIGRIFEGANEDAFDKVVKEDNDGLPVLDPSKWATGDLKIARAKNRFRASNCAVIR